MRVFWLATAVLCLAILSVAQQTALVKRNSVLRSGPSSDTERLDEVTKGSNVKVVGAAPRGNYYKVETADGQRGWIYGRNLSFNEMAGETPTTTQPAISTTAVANAISASWTKHPAQITHFTLSNGNDCADGVQNDDNLTFQYKNRTDSAEDHGDSSHKVSLEAIRRLPMPDVHHQTLKGYTPQEQQEILKYQGIPVQVEAVVFHVIKEKGEKTNCGSSASNDVDWHLSLVEDDNDGLPTSVVAEITPRLRANHPQWKASLFDSGTHVRLSGWLMFDPDHWNQLSETNKKRATLWEVHPITKVEIYDSGTWKEID